MHALLPFLLLFSLNIWGVTEVQVPALTSPVMDEAGFLSEAERADLSQLAYEINTNNGPQITILTVKDLQEFPIEDFSIKVAEKWQLGTKEKDNGLLIVIAKAERKMRIEVGGGIEGEITDYESNQYIRDILTPAFKEGQFHAGLKTVLLEVAKKFNIKHANEGTPIVRRSTNPGRLITGPMASAFPFLIGIVIFGAIFLRKKPIARGIFTGAGMAGVGAFVGAAGIATIGMMFIIGLVVGLIGLHNLLFALAMGGGRSRGGGFGGGGGGWGGGGGGFSGGGSSGSW